MHAWEKIFRVSAVCQWTTTCSETPDTMQSLGALPTLPQQCIGFSKFAELRPKHCILAGASDMHSVCVCTIHQNVKLMLLGARLHELNFADNNLSTYHRF